VSDHAELIERALAAVEADRPDLARGHDGRSCLRQSEGAALAAALAAEKDRADREHEFARKLMFEADPEMDLLIREAQAEIESLHESLLDVEMRLGRAGSAAKDNFDAAFAEKQRANAAEAREAALRAIIDWIAENMPRALELCPYKVARTDGEEP
jgi:hypothetical protein